MRQGSVRRTRREHKALLRDLHLALYLAFKAHQTRFATERLAPVVVTHETEFSSTTLAMIFHARDLIENTQLKPLQT
jgi:hypothetical protein